MLRLRTGGIKHVDKLTRELVLKRHKDSLETIIGSNEAYRPVVIQKVVLVP